MIPENNSVFILDTFGVYTKGLLRLFEGGGITRQAGNWQIEKAEIGRQLFGRVAFGINSDKNNLKHSSVGAAFGSFVKRPPQQT